MMKRFHGYLLTCVLIISLCGTVLEAVPVWYGPKMYMSGVNHDWWKPKNTQHNNDPDLKEKQEFWGNPIGFSRSRWFGKRVDRKS